MSAALLTYASIILSLFFALIAGILHEDKSEPVKGQEAVSLVMFVTAILLGCAAPLFWRAM
jgi:ABC-type sugar transport system permease subunit